MSHTNMVNQNGVPLQFRPQLNGVDSTHSSADSSPSNKMYQIPATQLPPTRIIPSNQLPPSTKPQNPMINQLSQNYSDLNLASNITPLSSPKKQIFSTSTPVQETAETEPKVSANLVTKSGGLNVNFNHSNVLSPITTQQSSGFTHSANSQFSNVPLTRQSQDIPVKQSNVPSFSQNNAPNIGGPNNQAQAASQITHNVVPSNQYQQSNPQRNNLPSNAVPPRPSLQPSLLQPRSMAYTSNQPQNMPLTNKLTQSVPPTSQTQSTPQTSQNIQQNQNVGPTQQESQTIQHNTYASGQNMPLQSFNTVPSMSVVGQSVLPAVQQVQRPQMSQNMPSMTQNSGTSTPTMSQTAHSNNQPTGLRQQQTMPPMSQSVAQNTTASLPFMSQSTHSNIQTSGSMQQPQGMTPMGQNTAPNPATTMPFTSQSAHSNIQTTGSRQQTQSIPPMSQVKNMPTNIPLMGQSMGSRQQPPMSQSMASVSQSTAPRYQVSQNVAQNTSSMSTIGQVVGPRQPTQNIPPMSQNMSSMTPNSGTSTPTMGQTAHSNNQSAGLRQQQSIPPMSQNMAQNTATSTPLMGQLSGSRHPIQSIPPMSMAQNTTTNMPVMGQSMSSRQPTQNIHPMSQNMPSMAPNSGTSTPTMGQTAHSNNQSTGLRQQQSIPPMSQGMAQNTATNMPLMGNSMGARYPTQSIPPMNVATNMQTAGLRQQQSQQNIPTAGLQTQPTNSRQNVPFQNMPPMATQNMNSNQVPPQMVTNPNQPNRPPNLLSHQQSAPNLYQKQMPPKTNSLPGPQEISNMHPAMAQAMQQNMPPTMHVSPLGGAPPPRTSVHANRYPTQPPVQQYGNPTAAQPAYQPVQQATTAYPNMQQPQTQQQQANYYQNYEQQQPTTARQSVTQSGFNKLWGAESYDLLQTPNILPEAKVEAPKIITGNQLMDVANCSTDIFRCTMTKIPQTSSLLQKSRLPLGVLIHPFRDLNHLPVIQCNAIVRCRACRTYINPFVFFVDSKRWKCNLCYRVNELPEEFQYDPVSKSYGDPSRRPEVKASTIEYIAPAEYMLRPPQPAVYLYLLDISRNAVESGYLQTVCGILSAELPNLPGDARTHIGFIAYDSALHFFSMADGLSQPHEMTVLDIDDIFLPCPDNLLCNLQDRMELVADLLAQLPTMYNNTYDTGSALGAALQAAHKMMAGTGGRVTVFQASLPTLGPGALVSREDPSQRAGLDTPHLNPANDFYKRLALECSGQQIAVDIFLVNSQYVDLATLSGISRFSGGCIYHFPLFKATRVLQNESLERTFKRYLTRKIGFEAVMRIRCTRGLAIHTFHGNFFVRSTDLLSLPNINPDAGFGMQVAIEESLSDVQTVCFQAALLYTSSKGERRIRVHTMCLPVVATLSDIINSADQQCIIGLLAKMAVDRSMQTCLADAREAFINVAIDILSSYKMLQNMDSSVNSGLLAPKCLLLLPLYISALLKYTAFRIGVSTRLDDRVKAMCDMKTKPLPYLIQNIYPDLYPVHNLEEQPIFLNEEEEHVPIPPRLQLTARNIDSNGAYLFDMGEHMLLVVCPSASPVFLNHVLGVADYQSIGETMYELPILENDFNQRLHLFVNYLNDEKPMQATLQIIRENSQLRTLYLEKLIEDRVETTLSYHEFLQHLKTQVK